MNRTNRTADSIANAEAAAFLADEADAASALPHIALRGGVVVEVTEAPSYLGDRGGLPSHVTEADAEVVALERYERARYAYADGRRSDANRHLYAASAATGRYGLASACDIHGRHEPVEYDAELANYGNTEAVAEAIAERHFEDRGYDDALAQEWHDTHGA